MDEEDDLDLLDPPTIDEDGEEPVVERVATAEKPAVGKFKLTPVEGDPFKAAPAATPAAGKYKLTPVDKSPFPTDYSLPAASDVAQAAEIGGAGIQSGIGGLGEYVAGPGGYFTRLREAGEAKAEAARKQMTPESQEASGENILDWQHPTRALLLQGTSAAVSTIPSAVAAVGASAVTGGAAVPWLAGALVGSAQTAGGVAQNTQNAVAQIPRDVLEKQSPRFRELLKTSPDEKAARLQLGQELQGASPLVGAAVTFLTSKLGIEGIIAQKLAGRLVVQNLLARTASGAAGEFTQEWLESATEEALQQKATIEAKGDKNQPWYDQVDWTKVGSQATSGAIVGAVTGGVVGGAPEHSGKTAPTGTDQSETAPPAATAPTGNPNPPGIAPSPPTAPTGVPPDQKAAADAAGTDAAPPAAAPPAGGPTVVPPGGIDPTLAATVNPTPAPAAAPGAKAAAAIATAPGEEETETADEEPAGDQTLAAALAAQLGTAPDEEPAGEEAAPAIPEPPPTAGAAVNQPSPAVDAAPAVLPGAEQPAVTTPPVPPSPGPAPAGEISGEAQEPPLAPAAPSPPPQPITPRVDPEIEAATQRAYTPQPEPGFGPEPPGTRSLLEPEPEAAPTPVEEAIAEAPAAPLGEAAVAVSAARERKIKTPKQKVSGQKQAVPEVTSAPDTVAPTPEQKAKPQEKAASPPAETKEEPAQLIKAKPKVEPAPAPKPEPPPTKVEAPKAEPAKAVSRRRKPEVRTFARGEAAGRVVTAEAEPSQPREQTPQQRVDETLFKRGFIHDQTREEAVKRAMAEAEPGEAHERTVLRAVKHVATIEEEAELERKRPYLRAELEAKQTKAEEEAAAAREAKAATPQKTTRGETKSAADIRGETVTTTRNRAAKEPVDARTEGGRLALQGKMAAAREWYAQRAEEREQAGAAPEKTADEQIKELAAEERLSPAEQAEKERQEKLAASRASPEHQKLETQAKAVLEDVTMPAPAGNKEAPEAWIGRWRAYAKDLIKGISGIPEKRSVSRGAWSNLLVMAKRVAGENSGPNAVADFGIGHRLLVENKDEAGFLDWIESRDAASKGVSLTAVETARRAREQARDEAITQRAERADRAEAAEAGYDETTDEDVIGDNEVVQANRIDNLQKLLDAADAADQRRQAAATAAAAPEREITYKGNTIRVAKGDIMSGEAALDKYKPPSRSPRFDALVGWLDAGIKQYAGDVNVYFVTPEQIDHLFGPGEGVSMQGLSVTPWGGTIKEGQKTRVFINKLRVNAGESFSTANTVRHELVHAATTTALLANAPFAREMQELANLAYRKASFHQRMRFHYELQTDPGTGEINTGEFLAGAWGNPQFQEYLLNTLAPRATTSWNDAQVAAATPTMWSRMLAAVQKLFGGAKDPGAATLLDEVMRLTPHLFRTQRENIDLRRVHFGNQSASTSLTQPLRNVQDMQDTVLSALRKEDLRRSRLGRNVRDVGTWLKDFAVGKLESIGQGVQRTKEDGVWKVADDGSTSPSRVMNRYEEIRPLINQIKAAGFKLHEKVEQVLKSDKTLRMRFGDTVMRGSLDEVDFTDPAPKRLNKRQKKIHQILRMEFESWPQELQDTAKEMKTYFAGMEDRRVKAALSNMFTSFQPEQGTSWPSALSTPAAQADWVMDGGIERAQAALALDPKATSDDISMLKALGKDFAQDIVDAGGMQKVKGFYFPAYRRGDHAVSGRHELALPDGATLRDGTDNVFEFTDRAKAEAYFENVDNPRSTMSTRYFAPVRDAAGKHIVKNGVPQWKPSNSKEPGSKPIHTIKAMNEHLEFFHSAAEARDRRQDLVDSGAFKDHELSYAEIREAQFFTGSNELAPMAVRRMVTKLEARMEKGSLATSVGQLMKRELENAAIRFTQGSSVKHRGLKRRGVEGASDDVSHGLIDYNGQMGSAIGRLEKAPAIAAAEKEVTAELEELGASRAKDAEWKNNAARRLWKMMRQHYDSQHFDGSMVNRTMQGINAIAFMNFLWTPQYWLTNFVQPGLTAMKLVSEYGLGGGAHLMNAYRIMGLGQVAKTLGRGFKSQFTGKSDDHFAHIKKSLLRSKHPEAHELVSLIEDAERLGRVDLDVPGSEIERELRGKPQGTVMKGLNALVARARAMPQSIEALNRTASMVGTYNAARAKGLSVAQAKQKALDVTETTQFDYRPETRAALFNTRGLGPALMFKQYGQAMMHLMVDQHRRLFTMPGQRVKAAKMLAGLSVFHWFFAGLQGAFPVEALKLSLWFAHLLGLKDDDDNWDDYMLSLRKWIAKNYNKTAAEVITKGPIHALGVDLSNAIQLDSLLLFKGVEKNDKKSANQFIGEQVGGAPFAMGADMLDAIQAAKDGNWPKALSKLPLPKFIKNLAKGYEAGKTGPLSPEGKPYAKPISPGQAVLKGLGFKPSAESDQQTAHFAQKAQDKEVADKRKHLIGKVTFAKTPEERAKAVSKVREFNKEHPEKGVRITPESYKRSKAGAKVEQKKQRIRERQLEAMI